jgi:hypothetical protein
MLLLFNTHVPINLDDYTSAPNALVDRDLSSRVLGSKELFRSTKNRDKSKDQSLYRHINQQRGFLHRIF